jgi:SSS family solute:Na+ symporter
MGAVFAAFLKILALFIIAAPGVIAAKLIPGLAQADQVYARLVSTYVPPGLAGLVLAGLLAAILGTVAAGLSAAASMVSYDFVLRFAPKLSEPARVRMGRGIMVLVLVLLLVLRRHACGGVHGIVEELRGRERHEQHAKDGMHLDGEGCAVVPVRVQ